MTPTPIAAWQDSKIRLIFAGKERPFRPYPAEDDLLKETAEGAFSVSSAPGVYQAFQIVAEARRACRIESIRCLGLEAGEEFTCLALEGVDSAGHPFTKTLSLEAGKPWPLWCLVRMLTPGKRSLTLEVTIDGEVIPLSMTAAAVGNTDAEAGCGDRDSLARLSWLNSRRGLSDGIPAPFLPVTRDGTTLSILGRDVTLAPNGMPAQIFTHFTGNNSRLTQSSRPILAAPLALEVTKDGRTLAFAREKLTFLSERGCETAWEAVSFAETDGVRMRMRMEGKLEFDGTLTLNAWLSAEEPAVCEVSLVHRPAKGFDGIFIGLGVNGGKTPAEHDWKWDAEKRQDACWIGSVNGGVMIRPRDPDMEQPFVNIYYHQGPRNLPVNWVNEGRGGFRLENGVCRYFSGPIALDKSEKLFGAELMISPFRTVDQKKAFGTRYYHSSAHKEAEWVGEAKEHGCNVINYHHGNDGYPFINYPMYDERTFHALIAEAHAAGIRVKPYYTVRELTSLLPEFWAFRSLGDEIYPKPKFAFDGLPFQGGLDPFIRDNMRGEVIPAWKHIFKSGPYAGTTDPALITNPMSRLANFYVEGLDFMCRRWGIDGIYIDDVGYDRTIMRRVRKVLDERRPGALIDLHSWNCYEDGLGGGWGHNALLYMPLMPYLDSLWIGEGFNYDTTVAEYLLVEVSGLPFGLMGEMLQNGGNPWRGMLYGMTNRYPWAGKDPAAIWALRDEFGFDGVKMIGFWDEELPVSSCREDVKAAVYENKNGDLLICFASFADQTVRFTPSGGPFDDPGRGEVFLPRVEGLQERADYSGGELELAPSTGVILWARGKAQMNDAPETK